MLFSQSLIAVVVIVHLHLEYRLWLRRDRDLFVRYAKPGRPPLRTANLAYMAKALWLTLLVAAQASGVPFRPALASTFLVYALSVLVIMPIGIYSILQVTLGIACVLESWLR